MHEHDDNPGDGIVWSKPLVQYDIRRKIASSAGLPPLPEGLVPFYKLMTELYIPMNDGMAMLTEYAFIRQGRPTWFITAEMAEVLLRTKIESTDLTRIFFPHEIIDLVFERGVVLEGFPLRGIRIANPRSELTLQLFDEVADLEFNIPGWIGFWFDFGEDVVNNTFSPDTAMERTTRWHWYRDLAGTRGMDPAKSSLKQAEWDAIGKAVNIALAAILMYTARAPDFRPYSVPRNQRYEFKGERENFKIIDLKPTRSVYSGRPDGEPTGRSVAAHFRGWVLRTLKNERYYRGVQYPPEHWRVVHVAPTWVGGRGDSDDEGEA